MKKVPRLDAERVFVVIESLPRNPYAGDIRKMKGEDSVWRRRIGAYRLFYEIKAREGVVSIFRLERRASKTYS